MLPFDPNMAKSKIEKPISTFGNTNLFVKSIPESMVQHELEEYFEKYGKIKSSKIAKTDQGQSKGYGFVMFESPRDANSAMLDYKGGNAPF